MNVALLCLLLTAAPKGGGPRAPADADYAFFIPRLDDAPQMIPFLDAAGEKSGLLRREGWRDDVHPLLRVDLTRKDSLLEAGLDPASPATLSFKEEFSISCVGLLDVKKFEAACAERLKTWGTPWRKDLDGVTVAGSKDSLGRVLGGYVLKGKESCAVGGSGRTVDKLLLELGKLLGKVPAGATWKSAQAIAGHAVIVSPAAVVGLKSQGLTLTSEFKSGRASQVKLAGAGDSPYAGAACDGLFWSRLRLEPGGTAAVLAQFNGLVTRACPGCDRAALEETSAALAPRLTGNALLLVQQVRVKGSLRTFAGRFFAAQTAVLCEAADPTAARAALDGLAKVKGAKALENGEGYSMLLREGELKLGVRGSHVYASNDGAALEAALKAVPAAPGRQSHGAEYGLDPERLARGLAQVPLVDVLAVPELAALLAISAEAGPLLLASEKMGGWADTDPAGVVRGQLVWTLKSLK